MDSTSTSSGDLGVSNAQVVTGKAILTGVNIHAAAADVVVIIYDNTSAAGTILFKYTLDFSLSNLAEYHQLPDVKAKNGLWVVVTGTGANVIVHYK